MVIVANARPFDQDRLMPSIRSSNLLPNNVGVNEESKIGDYSRPRETERAWRTLGGYPDTAPSP